MKEGYTECQFCGKEVPPISELDILPYRAPIQVPDECPICEVCYAQFPDKCAEALEAHGAQKDQLPF